MHSFQLFNSKIEEVLPYATAIELFHNFTLMHDDLMDLATIRRGKPTVHQRWDNNTAILSGDTLLIISFKELLKQKHVNKDEIINTFLQVAEDVHKGQKLDMDFELKIEISSDEYYNMIKLKTSSLIAASLKIGALAGGASIEISEKLYEIGLVVGDAFQIQDDLLDSFRDFEIFGKRIGVDIITGKKTALLVRYLELCDEKSKQTFLKTFLDYGLNNEQKVERVLKFYKDYEIKEIIENELEVLRESWHLSYDNIKLPSYRKKLLGDLIDFLFKEGDLDLSLNNVEFNLKDIVLLYETIFINDNKIEPIERHLAYLNELEIIPNIDKNKVREMKNKLKNRLGRSVNIFISYSHHDETFKERLDKALYALKRNNKVKVWEDRLIIAGQSWEEELFNSLEESELVLLLLSDDYISSDFCYTKEFKYVLKSHEDKTKILIPVIVRPCSWQDLEFGKIQAVPKDGKPINTWENEDAAWQEVIQAIKRSIDYFLTK